MNDNIMVDDQITMSIDSKGFKRIVAKLDTGGIMTLLQLNSDNTEYSLELSGSFKPYKMTVQNDFDT